MSETVFELLCGDAKAGRSINLAAGGMHATYAQARTLVVLISGVGKLSLHSEGYNACELAELRLLGCIWVDGSLTEGQRI